MSFTSLPLTTTDIKKLQDTAFQVRRDIVRMVHGCQSGHPGGSLGCADLLVVLYGAIMQHKAASFDMNGQEEDLFFLSNGHVSAVWYSVLARNGYFPVPELATFRKIGARLQGHPATKEHLEGIRIASGSLGQGLSVAIGAALAKKLNNDAQWVYCLMGDGELQEGQVWEAAMFAGGKNVHKLIAFVDANGQQIDGSTNDVLPLGDIASKWAAFGWNTLAVNGHDINEIYTTILHAQDLATTTNKPVIIIMKTEMGKGVDFMMGSHHWHGVAPNDSQLAAALAQLPETLGDY